MLLSARFLSDLHILFCGRMVARVMEVRQTVHFGGLSGSPCPTLFFCRSLGNKYPSASHCFVHLRATYPIGVLPRRGALELEKLNSFGSVTRLHSEGVHVKVIRRSDHPHQLLAARPASHRNVFFFY